MKLYTNTLKIVGIVIKTLYCHMNMNGLVSHADIM